jgi:hypothetical protein
MKDTTMWDAAQIVKENEPYNRYTCICGYQYLCISAQHRPISSILPHFAQV